MLGPTLTATLGGLLKDRSSPTMTVWSQSISGLHPDDHLSESTIYVGPYLDGYPWGVSRKMEARPQRLLGVQLMATRVSQQPISGPTLTVTLGNFPSGKFCRYHCGMSLTQELYTN